MSNPTKIKLNWHAFPFALIIVAAYLLMGFLGNLWHPGWVIFLAIPLYHWMVAVITARRVRGVPTVAAIIVSIIAYLLMGFLGNLWHPGWIVFFLVPIVASFESFIRGGIRGQIERKKQDFKNKFKSAFTAEVGDETIESDDNPIE